MRNPFNTQPTMRAIPIIAGLVLIAVGTAGIGWRACCIVTGLAILSVMKHQTNRKQ